MKHDFPRTEVRQMERYYDVNNNNYSIRCKLYAEDPKTISRAVVFGHGFGGHKDNKAAERFAKRITAKHPDTAVSALNWPCHGDDMHKKLCLSDCDAYLNAVLADIGQKFRHAAVYGYATSFGGYLFLRYIALHGNPFSRLALRCPAVDMHAVLTEHIMTEENLKDLSKGKDTMVGFDRKIRLDQSFLNELRTEKVSELDFTAYMDDILILHGTKDEIVPYNTVQAFADNNLIELIPVENADHRFIDSRKMDLAISEIIQFFENDPKQ